MGVRGADLVAQDLWNLAEVGLDLERSEREAIAQRPVTTSAKTY